MSEFKQETVFGLSDFLAAERTLLAWIRTGVALMGFGFVVARFGLYIRALGVAGRESQASSLTPSVVFGTLLVIVGVGVDVLSAYQYVRLVQRMRAGREYRGPSLAGVTTAAILAAMGLALAFYLVGSQALIKSI